MAVSTRRRKGGEEALPTHDAGDRKYSNAKRRRRKKRLNTIIALSVATTLVLAAGFTIGSALFGEHDMEPRRWRKLLLDKLNLKKRGDGCFGVDIHAIVGQEPNPKEMCINDPHLMPKEWRAPDDVVWKDPGGPWTPEEAALAKEAVQKGLDELLGFFERATKRQILGLGTDAVNSVFDYVISSQEMPEFHQRALKTAIMVLKVAVQQYIDPANDSSDVSCRNMYSKVSMTGYAHRLQQEAPHDEELKRIRDSLVQHLNDSLDECDNDLDLIMGDGVKEEAWRVGMRDRTKGEDEVYDWNMWSVAFTNCLTIPDLKMPSDTESFVASAWKYFAKYGLSGYKDYEEHDDPRGTFVQMAYLATHLQFIPTGYGRHYAYIRDAPYLYHYYRENFFQAMAEGGHDLTAEFIDMLATYGCSPEDDIQVRHGVRYMLHQYKQANHSFVHYIEEWEDEDELSDYDLIHKPWTGIAPFEFEGCSEPEVPGSYGHAFRNALKARTAI